MRAPQWLVLAAALSGLVACGNRTPAPPAAQSPAAQPAAPTAPAVGLDLAGMDRSVKPGNDFDAYANGTWRKNTEIPADRSSIGIFYEVYERSEKRVADLIQGLSASKPAAGSDERRIADYYTAFMDEAGIEKRGLASLQPELDKIAAIASTQDLARVLGEGMRADVDPLNVTHYWTERLFGVFITQGLTDPEHSVAYLLQGGLGFDSADYYLAADPAMAAYREKYRQYMVALLKTAGIADPEGKAKAIYALELKIARAHASLVDSQDIHKANNPWALAQYAKQAPGLDWTTFFDAAGLGGQKQIVAWQPQAIAKLSALTASEPLQTWKDYLTFHAINHNAALLPKAYSDLNFDFYGRTLQGTPVRRDRWKRAITATNDDLGDAIGKLYTKQYFPPSSKTQVETMVGNILAAFRERVDTLTWMTEQTRRKAKAKAETMRVGVGYPSTWRDYASLEIRPDDALGNRLRAEAFEYRHQLAKLGKPVDRGEWWMTPQTVNAVNLPLQNAMNFPAAILEPPFFDPQADAASNYGATGATIGHEISHGFDNLGAEFDAQGRLANWWTPEDEAHFKAAGQQLARQFDAYEALPGLHINGQQTLGENIADVSGLTIAYLAYQKSLGGKPAPVIDGLTGDQRFFIAYAQSWREKTREQALRNQVVSDAHAPASFRTQSVRNIDAWYGAFPVQAGDALYLDPKDRAHIW